MTTYTVDGMKFKNNAIRKVAVNGRDFVSLENVWLFVKVLIAIEAVYFSTGMPIQALAVAGVLTWAMWQINKF